MPAKRDRDLEEGQAEWIQFIDTIEEQNKATGHEKFPLDKAWDPKDYLPKDKALPPKALSYIKANRESHSPANQNLYRRRVTTAEAFHAQPVKASETDVFVRRTEQGKNLPALGAHEGPNFSNFVNKNHIREMERKLVAIGNKEGGGEFGASAEELRREFGQQRGVIGTAVAPRIPRSATSSGLVRKRCDFVPIIIVPPSLSAIIQIWNAKMFLEEGVYEEAGKRFLVGDGTARLGDKETSVTVTPGSVFPSIDNYSTKFRTFKVVDRADAVDNWDQVCACIVTGQKWQLEEWYNGNKKQSEPSQLFSAVQGFIPFFEEDKPPQQTKEWKVSSLVLSKKLSKSFTHIQTAKTFWEQVFQFMETHPNFRQYTLPADSTLGGVSSVGHRQGGRGSALFEGGDSSAYQQNGSLGNM